MPGQPDETPDTIDLSDRARPSPDRKRPDQRAPDDAGTGHTRDDGARSVQENQEEESSTRQRIIEAAAEVFLDKGFTGTRVVDIARRAGFTSGALYSYFDSRAELLAEAVARSSSDMLRRLLVDPGTDEDGDAPFARGSPGSSANQSSSGDRVSGGPDDPPDPLVVLELALNQIPEPLEQSDQMLLDGVALAHREPVAGDRLAEALGQFRRQLGPADGAELSAGAADLLVILVLGITSARALGLHEPLPAALRQHLADSLVVTES